MTTDVSGGSADTSHSRNKVATDFAGTVKLLILVAGIYCYFAGWVYAYQLFNHFGLSFSAIDISAYYFFVYAYFLFPYASLYSILIGLGAAAVVCLLAVASVRFRPAQWLIGMILLLGFPSVFYLARQSAEEAARRFRAGDARHISFVLKKTMTSEYPRRFLEANADNRLMLLTETKDRYYVFLQPESKETSFPFGYTFDVDKANIVVSTIEVQSLRKGGTR